MKPLFRNFLLSLKRSKLASSLNILGLSVAFAAFIVIVIQVRYELSFDKFHSKVDRIFRVEGSNYDPSCRLLTSRHSRPMVEEFIRSSPHVEAGSLIQNGLYTYSIGEDRDQQEFRGTFTAVLPDVMNVFDFEIVEGDINTLQDPARLLIPESQAKILFGNESPIGQTIERKEKTWLSDYMMLTVGGVYKDFPHNSRILNSFYYRVSNKDLNFRGQNHQFYVLLDDPANADAVLENFITEYNPEERYQTAAYRLTPMSDTYYVEVDHDTGPSGSRTTSRLLIGIAVLIMVIAGINFTNFATALAPRRIKSINTQKVLGNSSSVIRTNLICEAIGTAVVAFLFSIFLVYLLGLTPFTKLLTAELSFISNIAVYLAGFGIALLLGFVAGLYPAIYITSFRPALALKGSFGLSPRGRRLRMGLIGVQYVISVGLIIMAMFIRLQNSYATNIPLGFDKDNVALVHLDRHLMGKKDAFTEQVKLLAGINDVAYASAQICGSDNYTVNNFIYRGDTLRYHAVVVSDNFLRVMNIPLVEGRDFSPADTKKEATYTFIFNEYAHKDYSFPAGLNESFRGFDHEIAGIMGDIHISSVRKAIGPMGFMLPGAKVPGPHLEYAYIKINAGSNLSDVVTHIEETIQALAPNSTAEITFFDQVVENLYQSERRLSSLIAWFCVLAVLISLVGVFGLVLFETQYRNKEIGIRRVFGATIGEILGMFNRSYIRIVLVCFVISIPLAYYFVNMWLQNFAYRTPMSWWVYPIALGLILLITVLTVTVQSYRAATENPANSIKTD